MIPQRVSLITIGSWDIAKLRQFYQLLGWEETEFSSDEYAVFKTAGGMLSIWSIEQLGEDVSLLKHDSPGYFRGVTLSINVDAAEQVDEVAMLVENAGGKIVKAPENAFWGGRIFLFLDPENNLWEVAHNPGSVFDERGAMIDMKG